jgi:predicted enzyme related to lactoylglutathione lyase
MAGVLEQLIRPQKKAMHRDLKAMELETAKEILSEVFGVRLSEVDEMIQNRFEEVHSQEACGEEGGLWPQEFWLEG